MKNKKLGNSGLEVSNLCFGGNVFGWTVDEATSFKLLDTFFEAGGNFIDTADVYSRWVPGHKGGESETIIGKWMKARNNRKQVIIATKVGMDMGPDGKGLSKNHILASVEKSLARLQTDYIDLYISHQQDEATPIAETSETYGMLIKHGKVRVCGASNYNAQRLEEAVREAHRHTSPAYQSLQPHYNLYEREDFEKNLLPICQEYGLGVTPYYALASGFLSGKYRSENDLNKSARGGGIKKFLNPRGMKILAALDKVSADNKTSPTAVALAWLMAKPYITAPIASATQTEQLMELIKATELNLSSDSVMILDQASQV